METNSYVHWSLMPLRNLTHCDLPDYKLTSYFIYLGLTRVECRLWIVDLMIYILPE